MNNRANSYKVPLSFLRGIITATNASIQLNHAKPADETTLFQSESHELRLKGCITITTPANDQLTGGELLTLIHKGYCTSEELALFIDGEDVEALQYFKVEKKASYQWFDASKNELSTPFFALGESIEAELYDLEEVLNSAIA
ncbi:hypothetical protein [Vibrio owensii]|uniref:hypothetical protein n=1 Tax=Vibrio harveyi group TaxID=717610 RepID=UPI003CC59EEC